LQLVTRSTCLCSLHNFQNNLCSWWQRKCCFSILLKEIVTTSIFKRAPFLASRLWGDKHRVGLGTRSQIQKKWNGCKIILNRDYSYIVINDKHTYQPVIMSEHSHMFSRFNDYSMQSCYQIKFHEKTHHRHKNVSRTCMSRLITSSFLPHSFGIAKI
jgi:hypothetical protein